MALRLWSEKLPSGHLRGCGPCRRLSTICSQTYDTKCLLQTKSVGCSLQQAVIARDLVTPYLQAVLFFGCSRKGQLLRPRFVSRVPRWHETLFPHYQHLLGADTGQKQSDKRRKLRTLQPSARYRLLPLTKGRPRRWWRALAVGERNACRSAPMALWWRLSITRT